MNKVVVVLQARSTSSRLPYKALLTIASMPSIVLAAKRAANQGLDVIVATSVAKSDNALYNILIKNGINCYRGSLENVQLRLVEAVSGYEDSDWIVRLTGDNSFPDGMFINELATQARTSDGVYKGTNSPTDGLPYGMSAEIMQIGALRSRIGKACELEKEHVTTYLRQNSNAVPFVPSRLMEYGRMRCTLDNRLDFERLCQIYQQVKNPLDIPWYELCDLLANLDEYQLGSNYQPVGAEMTLGTVQLGVENYGRINKAGKPNDEQAQILIDTAISRGIRTFDTARAYGDSEKRIANILGTGLQDICEIHTKLSPLIHLADDAHEQEVITAVEASVYESCYQLELKQLHTLMLHRWAHYSAFEGVIWNRLLDFQKAGVIKRLGVSISTPKELVEALLVKEIEFIQLPMSILDHRWFDTTTLSAIDARPDIEIEVRSVFLQGILLNKSEFWPSREGFDVAEVINNIEKLVHLTKCESKIDLCLSYIRSIPWVNRIVVGMESVEQLNLNSLLFSKPIMAESDKKIVQSTLGTLPEWLLDPSQWPE